MAHRSQSSSIGDNPMDPNYLAPHYREEYRLAIDKLIQEDVQGYYEFLQTVDVVDFLARPEIEHIKSTIQSPSQSQSTNAPELTQHEGAMEDDGSSDTYWPVHSDLAAPGLDLGWPLQQHSFIGPTEVTTLVNPSDPEMPSIKEQARRLIKNAHHVIAVVMDIFTDVDIFSDLLEAAARHVPVYILLDELNAHHFVAMVNNCRVNLEGVPMMRVRTVAGITYYCRTGQSFKGQVKDRFLLADCRAVISGNYSFMWSYEKIHRCMAHLFLGELVTSFDEEFRILYAQQMEPSSGAFKRHSYAEGTQENYLPSKQFMKNRVMNNLDETDYQREQSQQRSHYQEGPGPESGPGQYDRLRSTYEDGGEEGLPQAIGPDAFDDTPAVAQILEKRTSLAREPFEWRRKSEDKDEPEPKKLDISSRLAELTRRSPTGGNKPPVVSPKPPVNQLKPPEAALTQKEGNALDIPKKELFKSLKPLPSPNIFRRDPLKLKGLNPRRVSASEETLTGDATDAEKSELKKSRSHSSSSMMRSDSKDVLNKTSGSNSSINTIGSDGKSEGKPLDFLKKQTQRLKGFLGPKDKDKDKKLSPSGDEKTMKTVMEITEDTSKMSSAAPHTGSSNTDQSTVNHKVSAGTSGPSRYQSTGGSVLYSSNLRDDTKVILGQISANSQKNRHDNDKAGGTKEGDAGEKGLERHTSLRKTLFTRPQTNPQEREGLLKRIESMRKEKKVYSRFEMGNSLG
ncbi:hypothetical protein NHX12_023774 [Muraenolepis orangiensis]|uniref:Scaffolding anchor of CK1 domain-containing protein n=1 Tax=Muraenolepis orangiensis TaxID=630683 RepID=A0A9Q0IT19_9TELE|nr:hypothetical protein NHX12_023774 [Muraenolepis orangiensis]